MLPMKRQFSQFLIGRNEDTLAVSDYLYEDGIIGTAIRPAYSTYW